MAGITTLGEFLGPIPMSPSCADPAYFATAQPWPPASSYPGIDQESEVSSLNSDDSPPARRWKLEHRPVDHKELASWRERFRKMKLRLWNLESCRTKPKAAWEHAYLKLFIEDLRQAIAKASGTLGRRRRAKAREAPQPPPC